MLFNNIYIPIPLKSGKFPLETPLKSPWNPLKTSLKDKVNNILI